MTGGAIKPASQNRPGRKRRKLADQEQKDFLRRILGQGRIAKDALAGRLDQRPMQDDELRARRLAQWKRTIPGALGARFWPSHLVSLVTQSYCRTRENIAKIFL